MLGPPDEIDAHPSGGASQRPGSEGGAETIAYPFEEWHYLKVDGIGENVILTFVESILNCEYGLILEPARKAALLQVPPAGLTMVEQEWNDPHSGAFYRGMTGLTTRLDLYSKLFSLPPMKFAHQDGAIVGTTPLRADRLPYEARTDFMRVTNETALTPITIQIYRSDLQFQSKDGVMHGVVDYYGELTNLKDHIVDAFAKRLLSDVPENVFPQYQNDKTANQEAIPLSPDRYRLRLFLKDDLNGHTGSEEMGIVAPNFSGENLACSSLILADRIHPFPNNVERPGPFAIGATRVRPRVNNPFTRSEKLGIYVQVYNLGTDEKTHKRR